MSLISADGENGFPGELHVNVTFQLTGDDKLTITYSARTELKPTPINLSSRIYFNLAGEVSWHSSSEYLVQDGCLKKYFYSFRILGTLCLHRCSLWCMACRYLPNFGASASTEKVILLRNRGMSTWASCPVLFAMARWVRTVPGTCWLQIQCSNHYAVEPHFYSVNVINLYYLYYSVGQNQIELHPDWLLHDDMTHPPPLQLKLWKPLWRDPVAVDVSSQGCEDWHSDTVINSWLVDHPTSRLPGFHLPGCQWSPLNLFQTGQGHCNTCRTKWGHMKCVIAATFRQCHTSSTPSHSPCSRVVYNVYTLQTSLQLIGWRRMAPRHMTTTNFVKLSLF